jgi:hypothetical protein
MSVAANGAAQVLQVTWQNATVYTGGSISFSEPTSTLVAKALFPDGGGSCTPGEPHVVYDEFLSRWVMTINCGGMVLLVSQSSDPTGAWAGVVLDPLSPGQTVRLGYDKNGVYVSENIVGTAKNNYAEDNGINSTLFAIPNSDLAWSASFAPAHVNKAANRPLDACPVVDQNPGKQPTDPAFFVTKACDNNCVTGTNFPLTWVVTPVTWSGTTATFASEQAVSSSRTYNPIGSATQLGNIVKVNLAEDHRVMNAMQSSTHIYATLGSGPCTSNCPDAQAMPTRNFVLWADLDCAMSNCVLAGDGEIADPNHDLGFPTIGVTANSRVGIVAAAFTSMEPALWAWTVLPSTCGPLKFMPGNQPVTCAANNNVVGFASRSGISTVRDPTNSSYLWTSHQYGGPSSLGSCWTTQVVEYSP